MKALLLPANVTVENLTLRDRNGHVVFFASKMTLRQMRKFVSWVESGEWQTDQGDV